MSAVYILLVAALIEGAPTMYSPLGFSTAETCEELKIILMQQVSADEESAERGAGLVPGVENRKPQRRTAYDGFAVWA